MKKNVILPAVLLSAVMVFGIGRGFSILSESSNYDVKTSSTKNFSEVVHQKKSKTSKLESKFFEPEPASVTWGLISNITDKSLEGNLQSSLSLSPGTLSSGLQTKIDFTADGTTDSNIVFWQYDGVTPTTNVWTGTGNNNTINENLYVQVEVNATNNGTFTINKVEGLVGASGTGNMHYQAFYSLNADFSNRVQIKIPTKLTQNASIQIDATLPTPVVISGDQKFYLRLYPYVASNTTNKQFGLRNLKISGTMEGAVANPATVSTTAVSSISTQSAVSGGNISSNGGGAISESGVVWSINENPTITDSKTTDNATTGTFVSSLSGLTAGTTYYVRAYATNGAGTSYGSQVTFTTLASIVSPTVSTTSQSQVTNKSFVVSGNVSDWGGANVTDRGVVYSKTNNTPTLENATKVSTGAGLGAFSSYVHGADASTLYYVRTFATNSAGTAYGSTATVTTKATEPDVLKVISKDGTGDYTTVQSAFNAVPDNYTGRWIIHIKPGTYTERPTLAANKSNVFLIGDDALTTIITNNVSAGTLDGNGNPYGTSNSQTMAILGNDFTASKITISNTFVNSTANTQINGNTQAVALKTQGDRQAFYDCRILGYQDTYLGNSIGRAYFKDSYIEGNVDFIFGRQTVVFDHCTTYINRNNSVVVAPSTEASTKFGFVFLDCNLTVPTAGTTDFNGTVISNFHFGRPWQNRPKTAFIRSETPAMLNPVGWTTMNAGLSPIFVEFGGTGAGATPERLALRGNEGVVISETQAQVFTIGNVFKKETDPSFVFDWMPESSVNINFETLSINNITEAKLSVYPNPFTDKVTIAYDLKTSSDVSVLIYDINGRIIKNIQKANQKSGINQLTIETRDLKTGIYFYNLKSNSGQITGKLIKK